MDVPEPEAEAEATPEIIEAFVIVEEYVVEPVADSAVADVEPDVAANPWSLEPTEAEAPTAEAITDAWVTATEPVSPVAESSAAMADPWAEPVASEAVTDAWATVAEPATAEGTTAVASDPGAEPPVDAEAQPTAESADPWAEPAADAEAQTSAETADPWAEPAAEEAPNHGYEFRQDYEYQPAEPMTDTETAPAAVANSKSELEWVTEPLVEPVVETGPMYSWYQPTTTEATRYEPAIEAPPLEPAPDA